MTTALLTVDGDPRLLPIWLDYHKHIFASVILNENRTQIPDAEINRIIRRFFTSSHSSNKITISSTKFIGFTDFEEGSKSEIFRRCDAGESNENIGFTDYPTIDVNTIQQICYAAIDHVPNNIIDFLTNIKTTDDIGDSDIKVDFFVPVGQSLEKTLSKLIDDFSKTDYVYYLDAFAYSDLDWGEDRVILSEDVNLLENTDFNTDGHAVFTMRSYNTFLRSMIQSKIEDLTSQLLSDISKYHLHISDEEHRKIINAMPWKKTESPQICGFAEYMERRVSEILGKQVKIFNDDIWVRICRPSSITKNAGHEVVGVRGFAGEISLAQRRESRKSNTDTDYNPCHRDVYLDFYRNIVNIYVPIVGSNELSSLTMQSGSHLWNERDLIVTKGGAYFENSGKKYSVDAIVQSRERLNMTRPNPREDEFILFSPYLIHGCSSNGNADMTRMSLEIRFIEDTAVGKKQEEEFRRFLEKRTWR